MGTLPSKAGDYNENKTSEPKPKEVQPTSHFDDRYNWIADCSINAGETFECPSGYELQAKDGCPSHVKCVLKGSELIGPLTPLGGSPYGAAEGQQ
jgi:hypothetical protein